MRKEPTEHVVSISPSGTLKSMHSDEFPLMQFGDAVVERASEIVYNTDFKWWQIDLYTGDGQYIEASCAALKNFGSYEHGRKFEVEWMNECRKEGVVPWGDRAESIAMMLRPLFEQGRKEEA
ncbi:MAG: hypothetical protein V3W37_08345 [Candidatus Binatia bacterium]